MANPDMDAGSVYLASKLGSAFNPTFNGGTLELDQSKTISSGFKVQDVATNTVDIFGSTVTMSGAFTGTGPLTFTDTVGGGVVTLTGNSDPSTTDTTANYTGTITITSGAKVSMSDITDSSGTVTQNGSIGGASLVNNGTFDISATSAGATVVSLGGSGTVNLGTEYLTLTTAADTFSGTINGTGGLIITSGTETLTGVETYTGGTSVTSATLVLTSTASLAASSNVAINGTLDLTQMPGTSLQSLSGTGSVLLGSQNLTLTNANGYFSGVLSGTGGLVVTNGTEYLTGTNTFTGGITVTGGTLYMGSTAITSNIVNNAHFGFDSPGTIAMSGVITGTGDVAQANSGITTITTAQAYTGLTLITSGTLTLAGSGSIATSKSVEVDSSLDIQATAGTGTSIASLSGRGTVVLGAQTLTLTNAADSFTGSISGTGGLIVAGGTETFGGTSTYTGTTTVMSGSTLALTSGASLSTSSIVDNGTFDISPTSNTLVAMTTTIGSLNGSGIVTLGAHTLVFSAANGTFAGSISGTGGLTINSGTETLTGVNTYTGATLISGGTLALSGGGSLSPTAQVEADGVFDISAASGANITLASLIGGGSGTVNLGAHTLDLTAASGSFAGTLNGSGGLIVSGGTAVLGGTNTYTGGTTIAAGAALQIGNRAIGGSIVGDVSDAGTLSFARSDTYVFSGIISGSGAVTQSGSGTTVLTAANLYTGGTTITAGTLQIGNGGTAGSILGNVTDNGTLAFGHSGLSSFGGVISGTGGVAFLSGTTTLTAVNTYTGTTAIQSGATLALGAGAGIQYSAVADDGTFDVSATSSPQVASLAGGGSVLLGSQTLTLANASGTFSGTISGSGGLTVTGGTQTLAGTNSYTGLTTINGGTLAVNGSITSSSGVVVNSGGTLAGTGSVSAVTVNSGGSLAPGSLTVNGPVSFAAGSNFIVNVSSTSAGKLTTTGPASLAGTLAIASADGTYLLGQKYTVLTANGGFTGSFTLAPITHTGAQFEAELSHDAQNQNLYLEIDLAKLSPLLPTDANGNQTRVVGGIDAAIAAGATLPQSFENLGNDTSSGLASDATQLANQIGSDIPQIGTSLFNTFITSVFNHLSDEVSDRRLRGNADVWLDGYGTASIVAAARDTSGAQRLKSNGVGLVGGANWALSPGILVGAAVSAGTADFHLSDTAGKGKVQTLQGGVYGYLQYSPHFYGSFAAAVAVNDVKTDRVLTVSGTDDLKGKLTALVYGGRYETGLTLSFASPYVAVQDDLSSTPAYSETAASGSDTFALRYASRTINTASAEVGLRQSTDVDFTPRWMLTPDGTLHLTDRFAWAHGFAGNAQSDASFAALSSSDFKIAHVHPSKDTALVSVGADLDFQGGLHIGAHLDTAISANVQSYTGMAGLGYTW